MQEQDVTGSVPNIQSAVLMIAKYGKSKDLTVVLTLSKRKILPLIQCSSRKFNSTKNLYVDLTVIFLIKVEEIFKLNSPIQSIMLTN